MKILFQLLCLILLVSICSAQKASFEGENSITLFEPDFKTVLLYKEITATTKCLMNTNAQFLVINSTTGGILYNQSVPCNETEFEVLTNITPVEGTTYTLALTIPSPCTNCVAEKVIYYQEGDWICEVVPQSQGNEDYAMQGSALAFNSYLKLASTGGFYQASSEFAGVFLCDKNPSWNCSLAKAYSPLSSNILPYPHTLWIHPTEEVITYIESDRSSPCSTYVFSGGDGGPGCEIPMSCKSTIIDGNQRIWSCAPVYQLIQKYSWWDEVRDGGDVFNSVHAIGNDYYVLRYVRIFPPGYCSANESKLLLMKIVAGGSSQKKTIIDLGPNICAGDGSIPEVSVKGTRTSLLITKGSYHIPTATHHYCESNDYENWSCENVTDKMLSDVFKVAVINNTTSTFVSFGDNNSMKECVGSIGNWTCTQHTLPEKIIYHSFNGTDYILSDYVKLFYDSTPSIAYINDSGRTVNFCDKNNSGYYNCEQVYYTNNLNPGSTLYSLSLVKNSGQIYTSFIDLYGEPRFSMYSCRRNVLCGNGKCDFFESNQTCPIDCPTGGLCGNGVCDSQENYFVCPLDCPLPNLCGNGVCESSESIQTCAQDCSCGNGSCDDGENGTNCPDDCSNAKNSIINFFVETLGPKNVLNYSCTYSSEINIVVKKSLEETELFNENKPCSSTAAELILPSLTDSGSYMVYGGVSEPCFVCERQAFFENISEQQPVSVPDTGFSAFILLFTALVFIIFLSEKDLITKKQ